MLYYDLFRDFFFGSDTSHPRLHPLLEHSILHSEEWNYISFKIDPDLDKKPSLNDRKAFPKVYIDACNRKVVIVVKPPILNFSENIFRAILEQHFRDIFEKLREKYPTSSLDFPATEKPRITIRLSSPGIAAFKTLLEEIEESLADFCAVWKFIYHRRKSYEKTLREKYSEIDTMFLKKVVEKVKSRKTERA